jgi:hypothetical protein
MPSRPRLTRLAVAAALCGAVGASHAVQLVLDSHVGDVYSYTLVLDPYDNFNQPSTGGIPSTIRLAGLFGVTAAGAPTGTDLPDFLVASGVLQWVPSVNSAGTLVSWTNSALTGTGNFPDPRHLFGFTLVAPHTAAGPKVSLDTNGFGDDYHWNNGDPIIERDVHTLVSGPMFAVSSVPEPATAALWLGALAAIGLRRLRSESLASPR